MNQQNKIGLVLGGGGIKGLAHIALLKRLDELNLRPDIIAGTSMGAIIGALYAGGLSGAEIESRVVNHIISKGDTGKSIYKKRKALLKWFKVFSYNSERGAFFKANGLFEYLFTEIVDTHFEQLAIPFIAVATDFYQGTEYPISTGSLLPAVQASMAVPGVFAPITHNGRLLVDGGATNNLPCNHVQPHVGITIASNVINLPQKQNPKTKHILSGALSVMLNQATQATLTEFPADIMFQPNTDGIEAFDFHKINRVLKIAEEAAEKIMPDLKNILSP